MCHRALPLLALGCTALLPVAAQTTDATGQISCSVDGYDVILVNSGAVPLGTGTAVYWDVPFARSEGRYTLDSPLEPGRVIVLTGALGSSYIDPGRECIVAVEGG